MPNDFISNDDRKRIIDSYLDGNTVSDISKVMRFKRTTVYALINQFFEHGNISRKQKGGVRRQSLSDAQKRVVLEWIDEDCSITLNQIKIRCQEKMNVVISTSTLSRYMKSFSYTFKRIHNIPERRNDVTTLDLREIYANIFMGIVSNIDDSNIIFIDEVGFNVSMRSKFGRSLVGTRPIQVVPTIRSRNVSVCCAMNRHGIVGYKTQTRAYNSESFGEFIRFLISELQNKNIQNAVFIMDNVAFHKTDVINNIVVESGYEILFLPPYSPFLNPIENMFSK
jgi:transposase